MGKFRDKVVVITGGAQGIGKALTHSFAQEGAFVAFIDKEGEAGEATRNSIADAGGKVLFFEGDIAEEGVLNEFVEATISKYGGVDYLINNACLNLGGVLTPCSFEEFNYVLKVGVSAPYLLSQLLLPHLREGGAIVNICSTRASMSQANTESYSAAKGGISALTHALAISLAGRVRVNAISPGWIDTTDSTHNQSDSAQHPTRRVGKPDDIVRAAFFLCDPRNSFITGENLVVDGGMSKLMVYHGDEGWTYLP